MDLRCIQSHGSSIGYRSMGTEGPAIVLIHGMAGSSETWEPVIPTLAREARVLAPDMLGHGASSKPRGDYSLGALASGVRDLMVMLGIERATIVGQSLGGGVAMQFAYQFPERCERLVLVSSGGLGPEVSTVLRLLTLPGARYALAIGCAPRVRDAGSSVFSFLGRLGLRPAPGIAEIMRSHGSLSDPESRRAFLHTLRSVIDIAGQRVSARDRLYLARDMPTMIVWGEKDPIIPVSHAHEAHEAMPGSVLAIHPEAGHYPHSHDPEQFARELLDFIATTEPAAISADEMRDRLMGA